MNYASSPELVKKDTYESLLNSLGNIVATARKYGASD
jgi:hypothetical protein